MKIESPRQVAALAKIANQEVSLRALSGAGTPRLCGWADRTWKTLSELVLEAELTHFKLPPVAFRSTFTALCLRIWTRSGPGW